MIYGVVSMYVLIHASNTQAAPTCIACGDVVLSRNRSTLCQVSRVPQVLERGTTLAEWRARARSFFEVSALVDSLAALLATLHGSNRVHRDLTPQNVLYLMQSTEWRLLDVGICETIGALSTCSNQESVTHIAIRTDTQNSQA